MKAQNVKQIRRVRRKLSVRAHLRRCSSRPRLSVFRSSKHIYAQVIDDNTGRTLAAATSSGKAFAAEHAGKTKSERAKSVGAEVARLALAAGVTEVVFDRGAARYHGRLKALADSAREAGLKF
ncbi:MAG TPA: 50S ribosomal protein L18 [Planctomycetota bacterium]|nr:50S ribosomal protein L18 [Planctomycetota bacterium]